MGEAGGGKVGDGVDCSVPKKVKGVGCLLITGVDTWCGSVWGTGVGPGVSYD